MKYPGKSGSFKLGPWPKGINNVKGEEHLEQSELRESENFVYDDEGNAETRAGTLKRLSAGSAYGLEQVTADVGIYFDDGSLVKFNVSTWEKEVIATGFSSGLHATYAKIGKLLYFTNGREHGRIDTETWSVVAGFGTATPGIVVSLNQLGYGTLAVGTYIVGITYVDGNGEESACPGLHFIELTSVGGVEISWIGTVPAEVEAIRIYMTGANGKREELRRVYVADATDSSAQVTTNEFGSPLATLFKEVIPVPSMITAYNGQLYFAIDALVYHSDEMNYGLYHEDHNEVGHFVETVSVLERGIDGIWIVADRVYAYIGENPKSFVLKDNIFNYPAVKFSGKQVESNLFDFENVPNRKLPYWFSSRGAVVGLTNGQVFPVMKDKAEPDLFGVGASGTVEFNGVTSVVTALEDHRGPNDSVSLQDTFAVRVVNRGITI